MRARLDSPMRARLARPFTERRALRLRRRRADHLGAGLGGAVRAAAGGAASDRTMHEPVAAPDAIAVPDRAMLRVRDAGGPVDRASYSCCCGYVFAAPVSTSVSCPVCGTAQAW